MSESKKKKITRPEVPLSESLIRKLTEGSKEEVIEDLRSMALANPEMVISRNYYRVHGKFAESVWSQYFGTFHEFKRQAGIVLTRQQHNLEKKLAKHASVDHYRALGEERKGYAEKYIRENKRRFKTIICASDLHDKEIDPFFLRVFIDTVKRVQPDVVSFVGDVFDLPEFGKYTVDPRDWDVVGRIKVVHEKILAPLRKVYNGQIDHIEGNHEVRMLRHLADATPALRAVLADLHGFTVPKLLGLDRYEVNYIAQADLAAYNDSDIKNELKKNYKIYWDTVLCHHFPEGRNFGLPGVNGHHHKHVVWSMFNPLYGAYEWHQIGCGHRRHASYCNGEKWHMGFAIIHVDTHTRATNFEYIPITDMAIVGGKWYYRNADEVWATPSLPVVDRAIAV